MNFLSKCFWIVVVVAAACVCASAQVSLKTEVLSHYYCPGDMDLDGLTLNLRFTYTNTGGEPIILWKGSSEHSQIMIYKNNAGVSAEREVNSTVSWIPLGEFQASPRDLNRYFVTLRPNESYSLRSPVRVFALRANRPRTAGAIGNGEHFLQLRIMTWPGTQVQYQALQASWKERGKLWTDSVVSEPMHFTVVPKRKLVKCR